MSKWIKADDLSNADVLCVDEKIIQSGDPGIYYTAAMTDEYRVGIWDEDAKTEIKKSAVKLRELRIFNKQGEYRLRYSDAIPTDVAKDTASSGKTSGFSIREIVDGEEKNVYVNGENSIEYQEYCDEVQYLDIAQLSKKGEGFDATTTGGGEFFLPVKEKKIDTKIRIRHYLGKNDSGQAYVKDWRLVEFVDSSDED